MSIGYTKNDKSWAFEIETHKIRTQPHYIKSQSGIDFILWQIEKINFRGWEAQIIIHINWNIDRQLQTVNIEYYGSDEIANLMDIRRKSVRKSSTTLGICLVTTFDMCFFFSIVYKWTTSITSIILSESVVTKHFIVYFMSCAIKVRPKYWPNMIWLK